MTTKFSLVRDINGYNGFGLAFSDTKYSATVAQATDTTLNVPNGGCFGSGRSTVEQKYLAVFSYQPGSSVWVAINATAAVPAGASFAVVSSELNPTARLVTESDVIHFITADSSATVGVCFYVLI